MIWRRSETHGPNPALASKDLLKMTQRIPTTGTTGRIEDPSGATGEDSEEDPLTEDPFVEIREDHGEEAKTPGTEAVIPGEDHEAVVDGEETTEEDLDTRIEIKVIEILIIIPEVEVRMTNVRMTNGRIALTPPD
jgi:hypothetical protein